MTQRQHTSTFVVNRYITEDAEQTHKIVDELTKYKETLCTAYMGAGKTTLAEKYIYDKARESGACLVFIIPGVGQLMQMTKRGIEIVCNGADCSGQETLYASTPDSLHKVMKVLKQQNRKVWMIVDECHNLVTEINFRSKFKEILKYKSECEKVIHLTATPDPLVNMDFDHVVNIKSNNRPEVKLTIQKVKKLDPDTVLSVAKSKFQDGEALLIANNNIKGNELIAKKLKPLIKQDKEIILEENYQENLLGVEPKFRTIEHTEKAAAISAKTKTSAEASKILSEDPEELNKVAIFIFTSFIKAGLNIPNTKQTTLIIAVDENTTKTDIEQTIGRLRILENIKEVVLLVRETEQKVAVETYSSMLSQAMEVSSDLLNVIRTSYKKGVNKNVVLSMCQGTAVAYDEVIDDFYVDELVVRNRIYLEFNKVLMKNPFVLKKLLEESTAVNLNASIADKVLEIDSDELAQEQKEARKLKEEQTKQLLLEIDKITDKKTLHEVLTNTCNRRHPEMQEYIELAERYQELAPKSLKADIKEVMQREGLELHKAYKVVRTEGSTKKKEYKDKDTQEAVIEVNKIIKEEGIKYCSELYKPFDIHRPTEYAEIFPRVTLIRRELEGEEGFRRTRVSKKKLQALAQILVEKQYYGIKLPPRIGSKKLKSKIDKELEKLSKKGLEIPTTADARMSFEADYIEKMHKKNLDKALAQLNQDLDKIYNVSSDSKGLRVNSIKNY